MLRRGQLGTEGLILLLQQHQGLTRTYTYLPSRSMGLSWSLLILTVDALDFFRPLRVWRCSSPDSSHSTPCWTRCWTNGETCVLETNKVDTVACMHCDMGIPRRTPGAGHSTGKCNAVITTWNSMQISAYRCLHSTCCHVCMPEPLQQAPCTACGHSSDLHRNSDCSLHTNCTFANQAPSSVADLRWALSL